MDVFSGAIVVYVSVAAAEGVALLLAGIHQRARRQPLAIPFLAAGVALILVGVGIFIYYDSTVNTMQFRYTVTLTPNGSGTVRVSLPAPVDGSLIANLVTSPGTSSAIVNRSGSEPMIEVTLAERTTLAAAFTGYRYHGPVDMTRADSLDACIHSPVNGCNATISLVVIFGGVSEVHLQARAAWSHRCYWPSWELDAVALEGERAYPAMFHAAVC